MVRKSGDNFQAQLEELEQIVARFEGGKVELDDALVQFERGLSLADELKKRLAKFENKVTEIRQKFDDTPAVDDALPAKAEDSTDDDNPENDVSSADGVKPQLFS